MENTSIFKKDHFKIAVDSNGKRFITKKDEYTKNHNEKDTENVSGLIIEMPEKGDKCPIQLFTKYLSKLHPSNDNLWQQPKSSFKDNEITKFLE